MELFDESGCFTSDGLRALLAGRLDETGRLEAAEHLAYCNRCLDRYTALLTADALEPPPRSVKGAVMSTVWVRVMQSTLGRSAVAAVAAVLALAIWRSGALQNIALTGGELHALLPSAQAAQQAEPEQAEPQRLGKPYEDGKARIFYQKLFGGDAAYQSTNGGDNAQ